MKLVDLSHPISNEMSTYPSDPDVSIKVQKQIENDGSLLHSFSMGTHTGTHLDAPAHIIPNTKTLSDFALESFFGLAIKVDNDSYKSLKRRKEKFDGIIYDTGWYNKFEDPITFYGNKRPVIPMDLIQISIELNVNFFGCDLPSVDTSGLKDKPLHYALLEKDIIIYESLANLNCVPTSVPFKFYGFPLSFQNFDGSPVRAIGLL